MASGAARWAACFALVATFAVVDCSDTPRAPTIQDRELAHVPDLAELLADDLVDVAERVANGMIGHKLTEPYDTFHIILDHTRGAPFGFRVMSEYNSLYVTTMTADCPKCLVQAWNQENPSLAIQIGDRIVSVNGKGGPAAKLHEECDKPQRLALIILRVNEGPLKAPRQPEYFDIFLDHSNGGILGADLHDNEDSLLITSIQGGMLGLYNSAPLGPCPVRVGDRIVKVSGVSGFAEQLRKRLQRLDVLEIKFLKAAPPPTTPAPAPAQTTAPTPEPTESRTTSPEATTEKKTEQRTTPKPTRPETTTEQTTTGQTTTPTPTKPDTTKPETTKQDTTTEQTTTPAPMTPETTKPETTKPETTKPTTPSPTRPDTTRPETTGRPTTPPPAGPDTTRPETTERPTTPSPTRPETTKSMTTTPEAMTESPTTQAPASLGTSARRTATTTNDDDSRFNFVQGLKAEFWFDIDHIIDVSSISITMESLHEVMMRPPNMVRVDSQVNYAATTLGWRDMQPRSYFAARWTGQFRIQIGGRYLFELRSDDGSALFVDGLPVIGRSEHPYYDQHRWEVEPAHEITLGPGYHAIRIEYFNTNDMAGVVASYAGPDTESSVVPIPSKVLRTTTFGLPRDALDSALMRKFASDHPRWPAGLSPSVATGLVVMLLVGGAVYCISVLGAKVRRWRSRRNYDSLGGCVGDDDKSSAFSAAGGSTNVVEVGDA